MIVYICVYSFVWCICVVYISSKRQDTKYFPHQIPFDTLKFADKIGLIWGFTCEFCKMLEDFLC